MKMVWKKENEARGRKRIRPLDRNLPFDTAEEKEAVPTAEEQDGKHNSSLAGALAPGSISSDPEQLGESFRSQGDQLAEDGKYREALGKWEAALTLTPDKALLHEQKAQILLEIGDAWSALKAATRGS